MMIRKAEMDYDGLREDKVPPPGGVHKEYVEERAVPQVTKQGAKYAQPSNYYYHNDHLGTPQVMTNSTGAVAWKATYNAFGNATVTVNTVENNLRFPGQYYDAETGFHYNWNRYCDPNTGRYITADPIGLTGGINLFSYVGGNPVNLKDLKGLKTMDSIPDTDCINKEAAKCLKKSAMCNYKALYFPICELVCYGVTIGRGKGICELVCGGFTAYETVQCLREQKKCQDEAVKKCPDICL